MPAQLARVDALLDDERFFAPFRSYFDLTFGRPSIPIETYLRLMFLKFRYRLGYESLCAEVADSIGWRRFTRIGIDGRVPHPTTLMKITARCGSEVIEQLNEELLAKAVRRISRIVRRVKAAGAATRTRCPDHSRAAGRRARSRPARYSAGRSGSPTPPVCQGYP